MTDRATFTYTGGEQELRVGSETFRRNRATLVTDPHTITEARAHPELVEDRHAVQAVAEVEEAAEVAEPAPEAPVAPEAVAAPAPAKPKRNRKKPAKKA